MMKEEKCLNALREMISEAILLGTKLSQHDYKDTLQDENGCFLKHDFDRLYESTRVFLQESSLHSLSEKQLFPLYDEIQQLSGVD